MRSPAQHFSETAAQVKYERLQRTNNQLRKQFLTPASHMPRKKRTTRGCTCCCTYMLKAGLCTGLGELARGESGEELSSNVTEASE